MTLTQSRVERELQRDHVAKLYGDFGHVQAAAQRHLWENSNILSIWLFGSRARGNATVGRSGWDLAVITEGEETPPRESVSLRDCISVREVENDIRCFEIPLTLFGAKRTAVGHCAFLVAAEGIPLAERNWNLPVLEPHEQLHMDLRAYDIYLAMITAALSDIGQHYYLLSDIGSSAAWYPTSKNFVAQTQHLSEGFIKAGFIWREVHVLWSHKFHELADEAEAGGIDASFVNLIRRLNGAATKDEGARYDEIDERKVFLAARRIENLCAAMPAELVSASRRIVKSNNETGLALLNEHVRYFESILSRSAARIRNSQQPQSNEGSVVQREEHRAVINSVWRQQDAIASCFEQTASQLRSDFRL